MNDTGIGARVKRKEDHRFITGKGQYVDDINLKDQTYAYFVRSPHAHAAVKSIKVPKWKPEEGVVGVELDLAVRVVVDALEHAGRQRGIGNVGLGAQ